MKKLVVIISLIALSSCMQTLQEQIDGQQEREQINHALEHDSKTDCRAVFDTLIGGAIVQRYGDKYLYQEDMVFSESTLYRLMPPERSYKNDEPAYYWPLRRVYYQIDSSIPDSTEIKYAMSLISASSSVVFLPKEAQTHNYIKFKLSSGNNSEVGMQAGGQTINLKNYNHYGIVMHEIMHALGFSHEACRQDRDDHITINWSNIKLLKRHNFYIYDWFRTANVGPIDFYSIMMYSSYTNDTSFVNDTTQPMFLKLDGNPVYAQSSYLSPGDIEGLKSVYGPPFHRVESYHTVTTEEYYGNTEHIEMDGVAYVKLYSDENCTTRASSSYPRQLLIDINIETYSQGIQQGGQGTIYELTIPAGVDSVCLGSYHNVEYYFNSDPYNVSITRYRIVNSHVAPYTPPATYPD